MKLIIDIDENIYTRLFDNGTEDIDIEDRVEIGKAIRKGTTVFPDNLTNGAIFKKEVDVNV